MVRVLKLGRVFLVRAQMSIVLPIRSVDPLLNEWAEVMAPVWPDEPGSPGSIPGPPTHELMI